MRKIIHNFRYLLVAAFFIVLWALPVSAASSDAAQGIDVSSYNNTSDWDKVKSQGKSFVMIKTGEGRYVGTDDSDERFAANYSGAGAAGLKRGVYHMACNKTVAAARQEAQYCLQILGGRKLEYPVAYDIENKAILSTGKANVTAMAKAFCDVIKAAGYTPMIYSYSSALNTYFDWSKLSGVKVWVAEYGVSKPSFSGRYHMWQYSDKGIVEGANTDQGNTDLNYSYLDATKVSLNKSALSLGIQQTYTLKAAMKPTPCYDSVKYTTSNKSIATVSSKGVVKGVKAGKAVITVKTGSGKTAKCTVTVKKAPSKVTLAKKSITLARGKTYTIKPKIPSGTYSYKYTYSSNKKSVATVNSKGVVKAVKKGTAYITVRTFNNKSVKLKVIVK